jgi:hypothetical protein
MDLVTLLAEKQAAVVQETSEIVERSRLTHYAAAGTDEAYQRLDRLYSLMLQSLESRNLVPIIDHMTQVAAERFEAGYDLREVQTAINVLEEAVWKVVVESVPSEQLAQSLGLVGTVLGAAKDSLARAYVSLATKTKSPSLDLSAVFAAGR